MSLNCPVQLIVELVAANSEGVEIDFAPGRFASAKNPHPMGILHFSLVAHPFEDHQLVFGRFKLPKQIGRMSYEEYLLGPGEGGERCHELLLGVGMEPGCRFV